MSERTQLMRSNLARLAERFRAHALDDKFAKLAIDNLETLIDEQERADKRKEGRHD